MQNLYFLIWSEAIQRFWKHSSHTEWKWSVFTFVTWMNALNLYIIVLWLEYFDIYTIPKLHVNIFPGELLDRFTRFAITFAGPFAVINYFLIFFRNRYEKIVERYKVIKKNYFIIYSVSMIVGALLSTYLYGILTYYGS
ncbi:hypothetical protein CDL62_02070 [Alkalitalea saponilacus]|uniref:Uncharacterized protein n=1 Tax=Alkalitalea saponilacus TaxID=889453 RepID=A0A1T5EV50_9BACT|nr:hypothetical protein CDL62_02070 [Alkalitalea saponilacus]SKB87825.1 hypothetical protein SAMN03080601_01408 [Alkalitalea saponilacus]